MSQYLKNIISESEKKRISLLHENRRAIEFKNLLVEQATTNFFDNMKNTMQGFPAGSVKKLADGQEVLEVPGKYYLLQDGTALKLDGKTKSTNYWKTPQPTLTMKPATELPISTTTETPTITPQEPTKMMTGRELSQFGREEERERNQLQRQAGRLERQAARQKKRDDKQAQKNCMAYMATFDKTTQWPVGQREAYLNELNTCCDIFIASGINLTGKQYCQTKLSPEQLGAISQAGKAVGM